MPCVPSRRSRLFGFEPFTAWLSFSMSDGALATLLTASGSHHSLDFGKLTEVTPRESFKR
jgi:hypothetical protein